MGNTVHRTLPGTPGSPAREAGAGVLFSLGDPLGDFRRATPPLGALGAQRTGAFGASRTPATRTPLGWVLRSGRTGTASWLPWGPQSSFALLGRLRKGAAGAMPRAPSPLFQPEGAEEEGARGSLGGVTGVGLPRASDGQKPAVVPRLQLLKVGGACRGTPISSRQRPRGTSCLGLATFPRAPRLRPPLVSAQLGAL